MSGTKAESRVRNTTPGMEEVELRRDAYKDVGGRVMQDAYMDVGGRTAPGASSRAITEQQPRDRKKVGNIFSGKKLFYNYVS